MNADDPGEETISLQGCYSITNPQSETSVDRETRCDVTAQTLSVSTHRYTDYRCTERQYPQVKIRKEEKQNQHLKLLLLGK